MWNVCANICFSNISTKADAFNFLMNQGVRFNLNNLVYKEQNAAYL